MSHRLISATYQLYIEENGQEVLKEQISEAQALTIYTGIGMVLPTFEEQLAKYAADTDYDFVLTKENAYGEYDPKGRAALPKKMFSPDGVFDADHVFAGAVIPLRDENDKTYMGYVVAVDEDTVTIDMNHPLAGKDLHFKGRILENRPATDEEVKDFQERSRQHHCSGHCGDCGSGCGGGEDHHCGHHGEGEGHGDGHHCCHHGDSEGHGDGHHCAHHEEKKHEGGCCGGEGCCGNH